MKNQQRTGLTCVLFFLVLLAVIPGCGNPEQVIYLANPQLNKKLNTLIAQIDAETPEMRFVLINEISDMLLKNGDPYKQILFLTGYVEKYPLDLYNGYYLYKVAGIYEDQKAIPFCIHYYERILNNYSDIKVDNNNIHYLCIQKLLKYVVNKEKHIEYYKLLLSRFFEKSKNNIGRIYYNLARTYEQLGEWDRAIQEYTKFLKHPETKISEDPEAYTSTREKVNFYYSNKSWTRSNLEILVEEITNALRKKQVAKLKQLESKLSFKIMYWEQTDYEESRSDYFNIGSFLLAGDIHVEPGLHEDSNASEAFLKTTRWPYKVTTWYFYLRRINFPADPEFDGRWEWAGIYFGEK